MSFLRGSRHTTMSAQHATTRLAAALCARALRSALAPSARARYFASSRRQKRSAAPIAAPATGNGAPASASAPAAQPRERVERWAQDAEETALVDGLEPGLEAPSDVQFAAWCRTHGVVHPKLEIRVENVCDASSSSIFSQCWHVTHEIYRLMHEYMNIVCTCRADAVYLRRTRCARANSSPPFPRVSLFHAPLSLRL